MVDKKFNFYNIYKIIYKNINKSVFFYDFDTFRCFDYDYEYYIQNVKKYYTNYFGIFYIISVNFILYTDWFVFKTIRENKINPCTFFKLKKLFIKNPFFKDNSYYFISL